jgi:tetratricopeptide (TPR) repeat protein
LFGLRIHILICLLFAFELFVSQTKEIDAYKAKMAGVKADSTIAKMCNSLSYQTLIAGDIEQAKMYNKKAFEVLDALPAAIRSMNSTKITYGYGHMGKGVILKTLSQYPEALHHYSVALGKMESAGNIDGVERVLTNMSAIYLFVGKFPEALEVQIKSLEIAKKLNDSAGVPELLMNIGTTFMYSGKYDKALEFYEEALKRAEGNKDTLEISKSMGNIANIHQLNGDQARAFRYYFKAVHLDSILDNKYGLSSELLNIGTLYLADHKYEEAKVLFERALESMKSTGTPFQLAAANSHLGKVYMYRKEFKKGREYILRAIQIAIEGKAKEWEKNCYVSLSQVDSAMGNYASAFENYKRAIVLRDSLFNESQLADLTRKELNFDFKNKEEAAKAEQDKKDLLVKEEEARQAIIRNSFVAGSVLLSLLAIVIFRSYRNTKKSKEIISKQHEEVNKQKEELETKNHIIEEKQKEILDSIRYAKRIQDSLLPTEKYLKRIFKK